MNRESAHSVSDIETLVNRGKLAFDFGETAHGEAYDRGAGTAEADAEEVRVIEQQCLFESGNEALSMGLVQAIAERFVQKRKIFGL